MARRTKDAPGRVTPKGGPTKARAAAISGRYTAPIPSEYRSSPWWMPPVMLTFFGLGILSILLNYLSILPGGPSNAYLLAGLGLIVIGFVIATRWH